MGGRSYESTSLICWRRDNGGSLVCWWFAGEAVVMCLVERFVCLGRLEADVLGLRYDC